MRVRAAGERVTQRLLRLLAPRLKYCHALYEDTLRSLSVGGKRWLDLGCGHEVLPEWRFDAERQLVGAAKLAVGLDYSMDSLRQHRSMERRVRANSASLPFREASFD